MKKVKPKRKYPISSFAELEQHNLRLQGHYREQKEFFEKLVRMLEVAPEERTLSNGKVAEYLRDWIEDMGHINDFLEQDIQRARDAMKDLALMEALLK